MHVMGGWGVSPSSLPTTHYPFFFHSLAHSFALPKKSTRLFSCNYALFAKNTGGGVPRRKVNQKSQEGFLPQGAWRRWSGATTWSERLSSVREVDNRQN